MIVLRKEKPLSHLRQEGFVVIDKPRGPSSHEVSAWVGKLTGLKAGHAGTLDPQAIGVLPVAVGIGKKVLRALAECDKEYICIARFTPKVPEEELKKAMGQFTGKIYQTPPKEAAVKRVMRTRVIHSLRLLEADGELVLFRVRCQHGTYIRVLCEDIGEVLGVKGEMVELRRAIAGPFTEKDAVFLQTLADDKELLSIESGVAHLPKVVVGNSAVGALCHGADLAASGVAAVDKKIYKGAMVALFTAGKELVGLGIAEKSGEEIAEAKKGIVVKTTAIVMPRDTYPRAWNKK